MYEYTDIENTGLPAVPDLTGRTDPRESVSEAVWSHCLDEPAAIIPIDDD